MMDWWKEFEAVFFQSECSLLFGTFLKMKDSLELSGLFDHATIGLPIDCLTEIAQLSQLSVMTVQ